MYAERASGTVEGILRAVEQELIAVDILLRSIGNYGLSAPRRFVRQPYQSRQSRAGELAIHADRRDGGTCGYVEGYVVGTVDGSGSRKVQNRIIARIIRRIKIYAVPSFACPRGKIIVRVSAVSRDGSARHFEFIGVRI